MPVPDFQSIMLPLLKITEDGQEHNQSEVKETLALQLRLSDDDKKEKLPSGGVRFDTNVAWSVVYLRKAGLLENTKRGIFRITNEGKTLLKANHSKVDIKLLKQYPKFREWQESSHEGRNAGETTNESEEEQLPKEPPEEYIDESGETELDYSASYWIFQANPRHYDLEGELKTATSHELKHSNWTVNQYAKEIHTGDIAFLWTSGKNAGILAVATIRSYPYYDVESDGSFISERKRIDGKQLWVDLSIDYILPERITRESLLTYPALKSMRILKSPQGTNFPVTNEEAQTLNALIYSTMKPTYTLEQFSEDTGIDKETLEKWVNAIERKKQAILYGPPGTGKTYLAERFARYLVSGNDGFNDIVQFHPAYAYEDFIQGIRPQPLEDGTLSYPVVKGRFLEFCDQAKSRQGTCVLIIDEINRANLARVFGELMYLLEYRDRDLKLSGGGTLKIPSNVRIIGTMNTADRSIALVDHALRRRFAFLSLGPDYKILRRYHQKKASDFPIEGLIQVLTRLNSQLERHYQVGISFFIRDNLRDEIEDIWMMEILPYLEEYFFDQPEKLDEFGWEAVKGKIGL